jgi:hypothetical protein
MPDLSVTIQLPSQTIQWLQQSAQQHKQTVPDLGRKSQAELAQRMGRPTKTINEIRNYGSWMFSCGAVGAGLVPLQG